MSHLDPGQNGPGSGQEVRPQQPRSPEVLYNQSGKTPTLPSHSISKDQMTLSDVRGQSY